ncbi:MULTISPECIES: hypothetical protein [unclassified Microbacterium]|uniref:hypothetical protein n=1 Tax=unclassified Microbacterium TaxID=2609290 RepID=UPI001DC7861D|nr:hypothetical protein [Actinomycetota bacterium]
MWISGRLPADAPDPRVGLAERVRALPFAVYGLVPQSTLEDLDSLGLTVVGGAAPTQVTVAVTYTLWRNPDDHDDPVNLAELDENTRAALDQKPPWPRPRWLVEAAERMRYPMISEAVRTTWTQDPGEYEALPQQLVQHVNHILMNHFRRELGIPDGPPSGPPRFDEPWRARLSGVNPRSRLEVDGAEVDAVEIDTDPFVFGIGAQLSPEIVVTVVIPRADLPLVRLGLATRIDRGASSAQA